MRLLQAPVQGLEGTSLAEPLAGLHRIYERIEADQASWISASPYRCPSGCGSCCEGFEPDVLEVEAAYLASWLRQADPSRYAAVLSGTFAGNSYGKGCVLSDPSGAYHCTAYGGRPLICRLFAFSGDRAKDGGARFRLCSRMASLGGPRQLGEAELMERFGRLPPIMGDIAGEAESLQPDRAGDRSPLRVALSRAAAKLSYMLDLSDSSAFASDRPETDGDNDNPDGGTPPMPRAG